MTEVQWLLAAGIGMAMLYTGLLFDPAWVHREFLLGNLRRFARVAAVNYLAVPLLALAMIWLLPINATLSVALLTLAALPCAPLVPAFVTLAGEAPDWPLFVFIAFSLVSIAVAAILVVALAHSTSHAVNIGADMASKLLQYFALVYGPMAAGALLRFLAPGPAVRLIMPARALTGLGMLAILAVFATVHRNEFASVNGIDLLMTLAFVLGCVALGAIGGSGTPGQRVTTTISTCFRNIALGIAFATVVLRRNDVTAYLVVYSVVTMPVCVAVLAAHKWRAARRPAHG